MTTENQLLPCPFCGGEPHDARHIEYGRWAVTCQCGVHGANASAGPNATDELKIKAYNDARAAWNRRTAPPARREQAQQPSGPHLFEFWWEAHMPRATQAEAWAAWQDAHSSKGVGIVQQPSGGEPLRVAAPPAHDTEFEQRWPNAVTPAPEADKLDALVGMLDATKDKRERR